MCTGSRYYMRAETPADLAFSTLMQARGTMGKRCCKFNVSFITNTFPRRSKRQLFSMHLLRFWGSKAPFYRTRGLRLVYWNGLILALLPSNWRTLGESAFEFVAQRKIAAGRD